MFKDFNKYLSTSFKVYLFVLVIIVILKLMGLDYFGLDADNRIINAIEMFLNKYNLTNLSYFIVLMIYQYLMVSIICKDNSRKLKIYISLTSPFTAILQHFKNMHLDNPYFYLLEFLYLIIVVKIYNKNVKLKNIVKKLIVIFILQVISNFTRNKNDIQYEATYVRNLILNLDYFVMLLLYQKMELEGGTLCQDIVGLFLQTKANLKTLLKRLQANLHSFKGYTKQIKLEIIIYLLLSLIWNTLTILLILFVAKLNDTLIECIFILTSFWLSKHAFGRPFHLSSMAQCFVVSNLTYYVLNRITTPLGISILVPIMLGVGLSYITSKLVKKTYKPLYKGMPEDLFNETILKVLDKDSIKYKICYDFFIKKKSAISLSMSYHYSEAGIRMITKRVNNKIKGLE